MSEAMIKMIAAGFRVQFYEAEALIASLDGSGDLPVGHGMDSFSDLLFHKYQNICPSLHVDLDSAGIKVPLLVEVEPDGRWIFVEGHHRLAWATMAKRPVPVVLVDEFVDPIELWELLYADDVYYSYN